MKKEIYTIDIFYDYEKCSDSCSGTPEQLLKCISTDPDRFSNNIAYNLSDSSGDYLDNGIGIQYIIQRLKELNK